MRSFVSCAGGIAAVALLAAPAWAQQQQEPMQQPDAMQQQAAGQEMSDQEFIDQALRAAPEAMRETAGVIRPDGTELQAAQGEFRCTVLSIGSMCGDQTFVEWAQAFSEQREDYQAPEQLGLGYMLEGHSQPVSMTDPFATAEAGETFTEGPHIMILSPQGAMPQLASDHQSGEPYVMWEGTPFAHIMMPVGPRAEAPGVAATPAEEAEQPMGEQPAQD